MFLTLIELILIAIVAAFILGFALIGGLIRSIFGLGRRKSSGQHQSQQTYRPENKEKEKTEAQPHSDHKKIFEKNEGEYVDFEEIK